MRVTTSAAGPEPAERARTVLAHAPTAVLEVGPDLSVTLDVVAVDVDGSLVLVVAADGPLADRVASGPAAGTLHGALVGPVPGPDRRLDLVSVHGTVEFADDVRTALEVVLAAHPDRPADTVLRPDASALLRMTDPHVRLDGEPVDPAAFAAAAPDPLADGSDDAVTHLLCAHPDQVVALAHLLADDVLHDADAVAPVRIDRFGVVMRIDTPAGSRHARLDFPAALRGPAELPAAMRELGCRAAQVTACPFTGEPRGA
jgi:hypothetical protein